MNWRGSLFVARWLTLVAGLGLGAWSLWFEPMMIPVREYALRLPAGAPLSGLRVAVLADLHIGSPQHGLAHLEEIVRRTRAVDPDLVLMAGDYLYHGPLARKHAPQDLVPALSKLEARLGVYAVLGNHDNAERPGTVRRALEAAGIRVLDNESAAVPLGQGGALWIAGISDAWTSLVDIRGTFAGIPDDATVIALTHHPDIFPDLPAGRVSLGVAGHMHDGQVRVPFYGPPYVPSKYGTRYLHGHIVENGGHFFVTAGLGMSILPLRFMAPPEIALLLLHTDGKN